jgi:antitoxin (DNA-binding transcriptional repressor) of toxin-antitoxin stability system
MDRNSEPVGVISVPLRTLNQTSEIVRHIEAGHVIEVTRNGRPFADITPHSASPVASYPFRTDPMGDVDIPVLDLPNLTDEEISDTLRGMGGDVD